MVLTIGGTSGPKRIDDVEFVTPIVNESVLMNFSMLTKFMQLAHQMARVCK